MAQDCLQDGTVLAFLGGSLSPAERATVEAHVWQCTACADLVTWVAADQASVTRLPGNEGRPFVGQLHPGSRVGRYQILGAIGRGGMGEVYAAYHPDLDRRVALKVVAGTDATAGERRGRLLREARAIARLSHPNVVTVHDAGTFGSRVFIVMELVEGNTIEQWLRAAPRAWREILDVFTAAGRGLAAAHAAGVVHRDFKPQNVMIAKTGAVRVMDFGLARLSEEETPEERRHRTDDEPTMSLGPVTRTGAFIGTPAYMSPEQFRREPTDARSDQFSFCVALHEALFGTRPLAAPGELQNVEGDASTSPRRGGVPNWLRAIVLRGASVDPERRYPSMNALLAAVDRGRTRIRRVSLGAVVLGALVLSAGAWRAARGNHIVCALPADRTDAVWSVRNANSPRRTAIHRAFAATGRPTAETSWERLAKVLDEHMSAWAAMYVQTCEATHVRGEQSAEVLDLRMSCLNDNLDQVRALTDTFVAANPSGLSHAVAAATDLQAVSLCADVALLRSAVPLPHDQEALNEVQRLHRKLAEIETLFDIGDFAAARKLSRAIQPEVEATNYKPLLGKLLSTLGTAEAEINADPTVSEATLRAGLVAAEAGHDDLMAARIGASLAYVVGYRMGREQEAIFWAQLSHSMLDRVGSDQSRLRSWIDGGLAGTLARSGHFDAAAELMEKSLRLKERSVGKEHPDYAATLSALAYVLTRAGHPAEALVVANKAVDIFRTKSDPDAFPLGRGYTNQGEALNALGRAQEAEAAFRQAVQIISKNGARRTRSTPSH